MIPVSRAKRYAWQRGGTPRAPLKLLLGDLADNDDNHLPIVDPSTGQVRSVVPPRPRRPLRRRQGDRVEDREGLRAVRAQEAGDSARGHRGERGQFRARLERRLPGRGRPDPLADATSIARGDADGRDGAHPDSPYRRPATASCRPSEGRRQHLADRQDRVRRATRGHQRPTFVNDRQTEVSFFFAIKRTEPEPRLPPKENILCR